MKNDKIKHYLFTKIKNTIKMLICTTSNYSNYNLTLTYIYKIIVFRFYLQFTHN